MLTSEQMEGNVFNSTYGRASEPQDSKVAACAHIHKEQTQRNKLKSDEWLSFSNTPEGLISYNKM